MTQSVDLRLLGNVSSGGTVGLDYPGEGRLSMRALSTLSSLRQNPDLIGVTASSVG